MMNADVHQTAATDPWRRSTGLDGIPPPPVMRDDLVRLGLVAEYIEKPTCWLPFAPKVRILLWHRNRARY